MMRVKLTKQSANAEVIEVEAEYDGTPEGLKRTITPLLAVLDLRLYELNMRVHRGAQAARAVDPQAAHAAGQILRMVNGLDLEDAMAKLEAAGIPA